ncbi:MAG: hypothetical protein ABI675_30520 [Chitinophagaceae bacterium]
MKRAKIMLMTIAVFAIVGTALAFKVAKKGTTTYCYLKTKSQPPQGGCTGEINLATAAAGITEYFWTKKTAPNCSQLACPNQAEEFIQ